jgi:dihydrofolate reductase
MTPRVWPALAGPLVGEHVFVVTHKPPANWEHAGTAPCTFVDGVEAAIRAAQEYAGDRVTHLVYDVANR